ncbi:MAG: UDP-N-acetylmuramate dehydrogenase [Candidatus Omnitrophota bacterium]|nr:UDP-N-acetylmuramate dehydrogenase [Candidatus Omnitrophota bacterium]
MITEIKRDLRENIKGKIAYNEPMKRHTSFCIGGPADIWVEPADSADLKNCLRFGKERNIPVFIIGGGTNLLVNDNGFEGIVISTQFLSSGRIYYSGQKICVTSSVNLAGFLNFCIDRELSGMEFLAGVPGSLGGAVAANAGTRHYEKHDRRKNIRDFVKEVKVMDYNGETSILDKKKLAIAYEPQGIGNFVILEVKFLLTKTTRKSILDEYRNFLKKKSATQELSAPSAGCVFKNPAGFKESAGELIEKCGLKGRRAGGAVISEKHANFIVNTGNARAKDVMSLMETIRSEVRHKFGVELLLEIKVV